MAKAKKKKRTSRKAQQKRANTTLFIMLAVIFIIIGIFVFKAISKDDKPQGDATTTTEYVFIEGDDSSDDGFSDDNSASATQGSSEESTEATSEDSTSTTEEATTEMMTLPINNEPESMVDIIISHYTDYMGFPEGALFINESETDETAASYTYTLRLNASGSPNKLIGDIHVEKGTGKVTDSMGNEPWYIS